MLLAALSVAGLLAVLRLPTAIDVVPPTRILVDILEPEASSTAEPEAVEVPETVVEVPQTVEPDPGVRATEPATEDPELVDWEALMEHGVVTAIDALNRADSVNPQFEEKRRQAAVRFRPSLAEPPRPIWENVEKDMYGRTLLWHKNCYRVLDDSNVGSRETFLTFTQYMVFCLGAEEDTIDVSGIEMLGKS